MYLCCRERPRVRLRRGERLQKVRRLDLRLCPVERQRREAAAAAARRHLLEERHGTNERTGFRVID